MDAKNIAEAIGILGLLGLPELLILVTAGSILTGFALYSLLTFVSQWMIPLLIVGVAIFGTYISFSYAHENSDSRFALLGIAILIGSLAALAADLTGVFNQHTNSYSLLGLSLVPNTTLSEGYAVFEAIIQSLFFIGGAGLFFIEVKRLHNE
ncbi:MAG: hypothetical protein KGN01_08085 [Patescibacteria group bacterium]|nr:hypothetical protein [Patescibacteria group bacterium]